MDVFASGLARLYETEKAMLRALARRLLGNSTMAEDVVQQAFTNTLGTRAIAGNSAHYIRRTIRNIAFNHLRDAKRRSTVEISGVAVEHIADGQPSPEMTVIHRGELRRLLEAVSKLPQRRREAFMACKIEGLTYDEIANRQGVSRNTVISQVVAAMAQLDGSLQV